MELIAVVAQVVIALGIFNVWLIRPNRPTPWRPDGAVSLREEFRRYGFSDGFRKLIGALKLTFASALLVGVFVPQVAVWAAAGMAILMLGAILAHIKVSDPLAKSMPALTLLALSIFIVYARGF